MCNATRNIIFFPFDNALVLATYRQLAHMAPWTGFPHSKTLLASPRSGYSGAVLPRPKRMWNFPKICKETVFTIFVMELVVGLSEIIYLMSEEIRDHHKRVVCGVYQLTNACCIEGAGLYRYRGGPARQRRPFAGGGQNSDSAYNPELVAVFRRVSTHDAFWFNAVSAGYYESIIKELKPPWLRQACV